MKLHACLLMVLLPGIATGQPAPTAEMPQHMVRAAGMPLNDGALVPGILTVRVVEGAFTRDLAGQVVQVEIAGGQVESAVTGADGRAQFAHLPVGARVRATASVMGARLESEFFEMPAQSGVRVLLVAGDTPRVASAPSTSPLAQGPVYVAPAAPAPAPSSDDTDVAVIRAVLATATISAFGFLFFARMQRR